MLSWLVQGVIEHQREIVDYFNEKGVSVIFLFRRNLLRRMVSLLANTYDRHAKLLNGTHKSHVHSTEEVCVSISLSQKEISSFYTILILYLLLVGWDSCKIQACNQYRIIDDGINANGRDGQRSTAVLQHHTSYHSILWRPYQKPKCKKHHCIHWSSLKLEIIWSSIVMHIKILEALSFTSLSFKHFEVQSSLIAHLSNFCCRKWWMCWSF